MNMNRTLILSLILALSAPASSLFAQAPTDDPKQSHQLYPTADIQWKEGPPSLPPGAKFAILEGDPSKEGFFLMRLRVPDGYHIPPHTHPKTERVTVISGTFKIAMGEQLERSKAHTLPAGAYGFWPAGMKHAAWAEGETVVQIHGIGPWAINYLNPADDPRKAKK
jgi:quercetin dioxygenase-like cupin family protein